MAALLFLSTLHPNCYNSVWEEKTGQQNNKISNSRMIDVFANLIFVTGTTGTARVKTSTFSLFPAVTTQPKEKRRWYSKEAGCKRTSWSDC